MEYGYQRVINDSFEHVETRTRESLMEQGFGVMTEVNVKNALKEKLDVEFSKYTILGACNPSLAFDALKIDKGVGLFMPCNVVLWENEDGTTTVTAFDTTIMSDWIQNDEIEELAQRVNKILKTALDKVQEPNRCPCTIRSAVHVVSLLRNWCFPEIKVYGQESLNSFTINIYPEEFEEEHEKSNFGCQKGDGENLACHAGW